MILQIQKKAAALEFDREHLIAAQRSDQSLKPCVEAAVQLGSLKSTRIAFNWENYVLMRCWKPHNVDDALNVYQIVFPSECATRSHST